SQEEYQFVANHFKLVTQVSYEQQMIFETLLYEHQKKKVPSKLLHYLIEMTKLKSATHTIIGQYILALYRKKVVMLKETNKIHHFIVSNVMNDASHTLQVVFFELLFKIWQKIIENPQQQKMIVIDESYFMFSESNYAILELLRNIVKRARKYNAAVGIITQ